MQRLGDELRQNMTDLGAFSIQTDKSHSAGYLEVLEALLKYRTFAEAKLCLESLAI
jgi:hypothetical protein